MTSILQEMELEMSVLLAKKWNCDIDPTGMLWSEKLDGIRAQLRNGILYTRNGNVISAPDWFLRGLPSEDLDGELWLGRGSFQDSLKVVRRDVPDERWHLVKFMAFDVLGLEKPFSTRYDALQECLKGKDSAIVSAVTHSVITSREHLYSVLAEIKNGLGEGVMLRDPESRYVGKRSSTLLKVKTFLDSEAIILGYVEGHGKYRGMLGALECEWRGRRFRIGSGLRDEDRKNPPPIGSEVTFRYHEETRAGIPREPRYIAKRDFDVAA